MHSGNQLDSNYVYCWWNLNISAVEYQMYRCLDLYHQLLHYRFKCLYIVLNVLKS